MHRSASATSGITSLYPKLEKWLDSLSGVLTAAVLAASGLFPLKPGYHVSEKCLHIIAELSPSYAVPGTKLKDMFSMKTYKVVNVKDLKDKIVKQCREAGELHTRAIVDGQGRLREPAGIAFSLISCGELEIWGYRTFTREEGDERGEEDYTRYLDFLMGVVGIATTTGLDSVLPTLRALPNTG